jgi:hypothetical protein
MKLRWKRVGPNDWEAQTGLKHRYEISRWDSGYGIARFIAAPTSGKRYARYIGGYHPYPTLEQAKAVVQRDASAVARGRKIK